MNKTVLLIFLLLFSFNNNFLCDIKELSDTNCNILFTYQYKRQISYIAVKTLKENASLLHMQYASLLSLYMIIIKIS